MFAPATPVPRRATAAAVRPTAEVLRKKSISRSNEHGPTNLFVTRLRQQDVRPMLPQPK
jgi:hypothetical protein